MSALELYLVLAPLAVLVIVGGGGLLFLNWSERNLERQLREEVERRVRPAE